ncbi:unnamed protein product [Calypogeia fissa]
MAPPSEIPEKLQGKNKKFQYHLDPEYVEQTARLAKLTTVIRKVGLFTNHSEADEVPAVVEAPAASDAESTNLRRKDSEKRMRRRTQKSPSGCRQTLRLLT